MTKTGLIGLVVVFNLDVLLLHKLLHVSPHVRHKCILHNAQAVENMK